MVKRRGVTERSRSRKRVKVKVEDDDGEKINLNDGGFLRFHDDGKITSSNGVIAMLEPLVLECALNDGSRNCIFQLPQSWCVFDRNTKFRAWGQIEISKCLNPDRADNEEANYEPWRPVDIVSKLPTPQPAERPLSDQPAKPTVEGSAAENNEAENEQNEEAEVQGDVVIPDDAVKSINKSTYDKTERDLIHIYQAFLHKTFYSLDIYRAQRKTFVSRRISKLSGHLEAYLLAHLSKSEKADFFGNSNLSSENLTSLSLIDWQVDNDHYREKTRFLFSRDGFNLSFSKFLSWPFASIPSKDRRTLKPNILPYFNDCLTQIRLNGHESDSLAFNLLDTKNYRARIRYKKMELLLFKIRFVGKPYDIIPKEIYNHIPNRSYYNDFTYQPIIKILSQDDAWSDISICDIYLPSGILCFMLDPKFFSQSETSTDNIDKWIPFSLKKLRIRWNGITYYADDVAHPFEHVSGSLIYEANIRNRLQNFLGLYEFDKYSVKPELVMSENYAYPSKYFDFRLTNKSSQPILNASGDRSIKGDLVLHFTYEKPQVAGLVVILFYPKRRTGICLKSGQVFDASFNII